MGTMQFKEYLKEELATSSLEKAGFIILKYLRKKTGYKSMFANLGLEKFKNSFVTIAQTTCLPKSDLSVLQ